jgi:3-dehydroquinate synthase
VNGVSRIRVETAAPYDVVVGTGLLGEVAGLLGSEVSRVAVINPPALAAVASGIRERLAADGFAVHAIEVPDAEEAKTSDVADACWRALGQAGFTRSDAIVGVGGGATTDLAGFVAATFLRGLAVVHVPTTLLGMVDAAVGGKTGINTREGKNLVGSFHEPVGVVCDLNTLGSLDRREIVSGMAEVLKCGFIADPRILDLVEADPAAATDPASQVCRELIQRSIGVKAAVVARDLREATSHGSDVGREALNYGHTFGHAIERAERYAYRHGDAISIGMVYVAELARLAGRLDVDVVDRHRAVLSSVGLPTSYDGAGWSELLDAMRIDKKSRGDVLRFVILDEVARPAILEGPSTSLLTAAFAEISGVGSMGSG